MKTRQEIQMNFSFNHGGFPNFVWLLEVHRLDRPTSRIKNVFPLSQDQRI